MFLTTCGSGWPRCCRLLPNGATGIPGGFAFRTKRGTMPLIARRGVAHGSGLGKVRLLELACGLICLRRLRTSFRNDQLVRACRSQRPRVRCR